GEADERVGPHTWLEHRRTGVAAHITGDLEVAEGARPLGVWLPLRDALAVEVGHLLDQIVVVQQDRPRRTDGERVRVAGHRRAGVGGRGPRLGHDASLPLTRARCWSG